MKTFVLRIIRLFGKYALGTKVLFTHGAYLQIHTSDTLFSIDYDNWNVLKVNILWQSFLLFSFLEILVIFGKVYVRFDSGVSFRHSAGRIKIRRCRCLRRRGVEFFLGHAGVGARKILIVQHVNRRGLHHGIKSNGLTSGTFQGVRQWEIEISHQESYVVAFAGSHHVLRVAHVHIVMDPHDFVNYRLSDAGQGRLYTKLKRQWNKIENQETSQSLEDRHFFYEIFYISYPKYIKLCRFRATLMARADLLKVEELFDFFLYCALPARLLSGPVLYWLDQYR